MTLNAFFLKINWYVQESITEKLYAVQEKLSAEEKRRKTIENELEKLKKCAPEGDTDFEVSCSYVFYLTLIIIVLWSYHIMFHRMRNHI